jgi:two-component system phosphate regulon sensor histidine kinase PhoR
MKRSKLFWQLYHSYLWISIGVLLLIAIIAAYTFKYFAINQQLVSLNSRAKLFSDTVKEKIISGSTDDLDLLSKSLGEESGTRISVILVNGSIIADTANNVKHLENHADRPEILDAIKGGFGSSIRYSSTLNTEMMYVAIPVKKSNEIIAILRTAVSIEELNTTINKMLLVIGLVSGLFIVLAALISLYLSRRIGTPLKEMAKKFERIANHDFTGDLLLSRYDSEEMEVLASAINNLSIDFQGKLEEIYKLENMRREFVANVSHELKTPITSIKGFVETLIDGAINDKDEAENFLKIVLRQADRLDSIINDLLSISRLESDAGHDEMIIESSPVAHAVNGAIDACLSKAKSNNIKLDVICDQNLEAKIDIQLLEQALINLIDNAIKYSGTTDPVVVRASKKESKVIISIKDSGIGIPSKHQSRIFERFYRVDKGRSREKGGTGLGLSIVKHIVALHKGEIEMKSKLGEGTEFLIILNS